MSVTGRLIDGAFDAYTKEQAQRYRRNRAAAKAARHARRVRRMRGGK